MTISELIQKLQQLPQDAPVCILDTERNAYYADDEGSLEGAYGDFEIAYIEDVPDENKPFAALCFNREKSEVDIYKLIDQAERIIDDPMIGAAARIYYPVQEIKYDIEGEETVHKLIVMLDYIHGRKA